MDSQAVLKIENTDIFQEDYKVLENINFSINKGEFVYLVGKTGSGKSSLLKTLYADLALAKGNIEVAGISIKDIPGKQIPQLRRKIGIIFQDFELLTDRSVYENLSFVLKATGWKGKSKIKNRISEVLMSVGLESSSQKMPHQLSGGEQQRIAIARAILNEPSLLICDEPTGNLDPEVAEGILQLFFKINNSGSAVLMATHNHNFLEKFPRRVLTCKDQTILDSSSDQTDSNLES